ncbi:chorion peroxidase-like [Mytilus galloprovincialis]|uniref:chorion peroxidase-like n=1 Tax=Mytilus galloprovincialis TaxID=29158 RepID=UPI003F7B45AC
MAVTLLQETCNSYAKYRTYDGSCNNLMNPSWGKAKTPQRRFEYDGHKMVAYDAYREQINDVTSYIDCSHVYGSSDAQLATLRDTTDSFLLKTSPGNNLPERKTGFCRRKPESTDFCQLTGTEIFRDSRNDQVPSLQLNHLVLVREHNRLANMLKQINPYWDNDRVFEETRRIVIAEMQHITYNEYLPAILSPRTMRKFNLNPRKCGFDDCYSDKIDASSCYGVNAMRNRLFNRSNDLFSINTQRGRDQGVPSYNDWREFCGLKRVTFKDFPKKFQYDLQDLYGSCDEIDLFVGGLLEKSKNGRVGETFECIIGKQFHLTKYGDRYWYERKECGFTEAQLNAIKEMTMSKVLCENFELDRIQKKAFLRPKNKG